MNEYLRKSVGDRRTGANITGINVNLDNMNNLTNDFTHAFTEIENFARKSDELAIRNEKTKLLLDIEQRKVNFRQTYLDDPSTYASDEKFNEVGRLYKEEMTQAQKEILASEYLSSDEKMILNKEIKLDFSKTWLEPAKKRNMMVSQERINDAVMINDTLINVYSGEDFNRTDILPNYVKRATQSFNPLVEMGILTEGDVNKALVKGMSTIEGNRLKKNALNKIINNDTYTDTQKEKMLKEAMDELGSEERIKALAETLTSKYGFDEEEKEYFISSLKKQYSDAKANLQGTLERRVTNRKAVVKEMNDKYLKAYNEGNFYDYVKATGNKITGKQLLENEQASLMSSSRESSLVYQVTGKTLPEINKGHLFIKNLLPKETVQNIKGQIKTLQDDGMGLYDATYNVLTPILKDVDKDIGTAIINSLSMEDQQFSNEEYKIMLNAIKDPEGDANFGTCKRINSLMEKGGNPTPNDIAMLGQIGTIKNLATKIVKQSNNKMTQQNATAIVISLAMGLNLEENIVSVDGLPNDVKNRVDFIEHIMTDKNGKLLKTLERKLDGDFINMIARTKSKKHILKQVKFK